MANRDFTEMMIQQLISDHSKIFQAELALALDDRQLKKELKPLFTAKNDELPILNEAYLWGAYLEKGDFSREATMDLQMSLGEHSPSTKELELIAGKIGNEETPVLASRSQEDLGSYRSEILPKFQQYLFNSGVSRDSAFYLSVRLNTYLSFLWEIEKERVVVYDFSMISMMDCLDKMQGSRKDQDFVQMFALLTAIYHFQTCLEDWKALGAGKPEENRKNILTVWKMLSGAASDVLGSGSGFSQIVSERELFIQL